MDEVFGEDNFVGQISFRKKLMPLGAKIFWKTWRTSFFGTQRTKM